ncbi:MAG TPA: hypothetical protein VG323_12505 [Thermoanaerobaculia bacterium]|nr:hypothetical protein [Thermoanaerobaculia bacterium]
MKSLIAAVSLFAAGVATASVQPLLPDQAAAPVTYTVAPENNQLARLATDGNTTFAVWATPTALLGARLSRDGTVLDVPARVIADGVAWYDSRWRLAWVGGHYLVVWTLQNRMFVRRFAGDGSPLDLLPRRIGTSWGLIALVTDGVNAAFVTEDNSGSGVQRIDADGNLLGTAVAIDPTENVFAAAANSGGVVVLSLLYENGQYHSNSIRIGWDGSIRKTSLLPLSGRIVAGGDRFLVVGSGATLLLDADGAPLGAPLTLQMDSQLSMNGAWNGSSWAVSSVNRNGSLNLYRITLDGRLDFGPQVTGLGGPGIVDDIVWNGAKFVLASSSPECGSCDEVHVRTVLVESVETAADDARTHIAVAYSAAEQRGGNGSIASTDTTSLVTWTERTGIGAFIVRGAFVAAGHISPPFDIAATDYTSVPPAAATDGHDFFVVWGAPGKVMGRTVSAQQLLGTPVQLNAYATPGALAAAWSGREYVIAWAAPTPLLVRVSRSGAVLGPVIGTWIFAYDNGDAALSLACDETECALATRTVESLPGLEPAPLPESGVFGVRIALDANSAQPAVRFTREYSGPPPVAMRIGGVSMIVYTESQGTTLRAARLDSGVMTPLVTRPVPLSPVAADRSGLYWSETSADGNVFLHWSSMTAQTTPAMLTTLDLGDAIPAPIAAASTGSLAHVLFTTGTSDPALLAPRIFMRTFATPDPRPPAPPPPPRRRAAGH